MRIWLYGKPFSGKTTFASDIPNSVILSTDGNATELFKKEDIVPIKSVDDISNFIKEYQYCYWNSKCGKHYHGW